MNNDKSIENPENEEKNQINKAFLNEILKNSAKKEKKLNKCLPLEGKFLNYRKKIRKLINFRNKRGNFGIDSPKKIIGHSESDIAGNIIFFNKRKMFPHEERKFKVSWKINNHGVKPYSSEIKGKDLAKKYPLLLLNYYEKKAFFLC